MIGDKLVITDYHRQAAAQAIETVKPMLGKGRLAISVSGESGSGKSETGHCLGELIEKEGYKVVVLAQDDYFRLPPKTNGKYRKTDLDWVGNGEVNLGLMSRNVKQIKDGAARIVKPLVNFDEDKIGGESLEDGPWDVVISEGTYTSLLEGLDVRVFINRTYHQTKKARLKRAREEVEGDFIEKVLDKEHGIISKEKARADVVIAPPPEEA
jgi:uridine kinase